MKLFQSFVLMLALLILPTQAFAQLNVPQGGTGQTSFTADRILYGDTALRLGSEAAFTYDAPTNLLTVTNGIFTLATSTTLCLAGDGCITSWPTASFNSTAVDATTWSDGANASNIWTFDLSGTDTTLTFGSDLFTFNGGLTVTTGNTIILGTTQWNSGDGIDGEVIANDTIDDDSIDFADVDLADFDIDSFTGDTGDDDVLDVAVGGTGVGTLTDGGIMLGSGTGDVTVMSVLANGSIVVGDGTTDPVALAAFTSSTGDLIHEAGGLEADVSGYSNGLYGMLSNVTADIDTIGELETAVSATNIILEADFDASSELAALMDDETGFSGAALLMFSNYPIFLDQDAAPSAAGSFGYDNTVTGLDDGAFTWYDDDEVRYIVDLDTLPSDDGYVVAYDATLDKFYMKVDNAGAGGGAGLATSTAIADTLVIYGTSAGTVGAEAAFAYDDATDTLTLGLLSLGGDTIDEFVGDGFALSSGDLIFDCSDVVGTGVSCSGEDIILNITEGTAIDFSGATVSFDPSEITGGTTWDTGGSASVSWNWSLSGATDPGVTFSNDLMTWGNSLTLSTGNNFTLGTTQWNSGDGIDGEVIAADTIDDDSIDFADVTGADITLTDAGAITSSGIVTAAVGFDCTGAADCDFGSADITDMTFVTDGGTVTIDGSLTLETGDNLIVGANTLTTSDLLDGEMIGNDTIDDDSIDFADVTLADITFDVGSVDTTEFGYLNGVTSAIQTQLAAKFDTAGRSLSNTGTTIDADAELYTETKCIYFEDPVADDDFKSIWANKTAGDYTLTEIWGESDQTVSFDLQIDDGSPADVNGSDIAPAAGEAEDTSLSGDTTLAAGEELDLDITSVTNTPTWVSICWTFTKND